MNQFLLNIKPLGADVPFPCYYVSSTAPINIEGDLPKPTDKPTGEPTDPNRYIQEISQFLQQNADQAEVLVLIHGYNNGSSFVEWTYREACKLIAQQHKDIPKGLVILGYRWPSEEIAGPDSKDLKANLGIAWKALPKVVKGTAQLAIGLLLTSFVGGALSGAFVLWQSGWWLGASAFFSALAVLAMVIATPILTLVALRVSVYFRDSFRANAYGVADLVELIRQLDNAMVRSTPGQTLTEQTTHLKQNRIRLSFMGHSMGSFVVTNAVRILSDVFDTRSIGDLNLHSCKAQPSSAIGNAFCLGRLVLVAPDIPAETLISGRGNVLRTSLRRFEEAYLFSNEGDMALQLASTTANYFSFPARTRDAGYRLGTVTVRRRAFAEDEWEQLMPREQYGMVNLRPDGSLITEQPFLSYLFGSGKKSLQERQTEVGLMGQQQSIAELFTYFDCTNYRETITDPQTGKPVSKGIVSLATGKASLSFWDFCALIWSFARGKLDPHGGYIFTQEAKLSKYLIYGLSTMGLKGLINQEKQQPKFAAILQQMAETHGHLSQTQQEHLALNLLFSQRCQDQGIQILLAPERYQADILGEDCDRRNY
ncbi:MAG: alpha/beta hydrolase [Alkalinema sp. RU_4_3]|nr:alpha/beta hydrolase [Alkalinema sp. RU_4_3]